MGFYTHMDMAAKGLEGENWKGIIDLLWQEM